MRTSTFGVEALVPRACPTPISAARSLRASLSPTVNPLSSQAMHRDHQCWYSDRLNRYMGVAIYGNYGAPILAFPTSCGDEWEMEGQGMIRTLSPYLEQGRIRIFCINSVQQRLVPKQGSASLSSELDAGAVRCLCGERGFSVH